MVKVNLLSGHGLGFYDFFNAFFFAQGGDVVFGFFGAIGAKNFDAVGLCVFGEGFYHCVKVTCNTTFYGSDFSTKGLKVDAFKGFGAGGGVVPSV